jgi:hydroxylamine oxidation protein HaoB
MGTAIALAVVGLGGLFWWVSDRPTDSATPLYGYAALNDAPSPESLALTAMIPQATVELVQLQVPDGAGGHGAAVRAEVLTRADGNRVVLSWQNLTPEPVLRSDIRATEELALIEALRKHLPEGATVLAMPDTSQRLSHFVTARFPLAEAVEPLRLPAPWARAREPVVAIEAAAWGARAGTGEAEAAREDFLDALILEDIHGAARLRVLAGVAEGYVILHQRDLFALSLMRPDAFPVAQRDFIYTPSAHDMAREVKTFAATENYPAYAIERAGGDLLRAWFLEKPQQKSMLISQLLPFNTARIAMTPGASIVFQTGGYWVYRLTPVETES